MIALDKIAKVQIWDTAGQERYRSITNAYYRGAEAIIIIFDVSDKETFKSIPNWIEEVKKYTDKEVLIVVGANKYDLDNKEVTEENIQKFNKDTGISVFKISAKTGEGVEDMFKNIVENLIQKKATKKDEKNNIELNKDNNAQNNTNKKCC